MEIISLKQIISKIYYSVYYSVYSVYFGKMRLCHDSILMNKY